MDALKFAPGVSNKISAGQLFITLRKANKKIAVGDKLTFQEIDDAGEITAELGTGACIGVVPITIECDAISLGEREGFWSEKRFNGHQQTNWHLPQDTHYRDGSWGVSTFTARPENLEAFAKADGFVSFDELGRWIVETYGRLPFNGKLFICVVDA